MSTEGIEAIYLETHNWGKSVRFFQALGYQLEFETDHHSGQLRNGDGPYLFVAEVPADQVPTMQATMKVADAATFTAGPDVDVVSEFEDTHWGTRQMIVRDPDGRLWSLETPAS